MLKFNCFLGVNLAIASTCFICNYSALAEIIPDQTLPSKSTVLPVGNTLVITNGTSAGTNLFHSFEQFSVLTGQAAYFNNAPTIENIITRVTGGYISQIDGLIRSNGTANLYLINPNGIIFGPNAKLNIGGSFIGSTANSIKFADGSEFSATNPQAPHLLTINVPIGLQIGQNPAPIVVQGGGGNLRFNSGSSAIIRDNRNVGLQVGLDRTLALVGGDIALEGGNLTAQGGRIELWSVKNGWLGITNSHSKLAISNEQATQFGDIGFTSAASIDASGSGGGAIQVQGRRISLQGGAAILATTLGRGAGGDITVQASESVEVLGFDRILLFPSVISTSSQAGTSGKAGNITLETPSLLVGNGGRLAAATFGSGNAGSMTIRANSVEVFGTLGNSSAGGLFTFAALGSTGNAGNLTIETQRLRLVDGARIQSGTTGAGNGSNLTIKATESVEVIGFGEFSNPALPNNFIVGSTIASSVTRRGVRGNAGNLTIETGRLTVSGGAQIVTSTFGLGKGGDLTVRATDSVELIGTSRTNPLAISTLAASAGPNSTGNAGTLRIETGQLTIRDGATAAVTNQAPTGTAGNLVVNADSIKLLGGGSLDAQTTAGERGNITINSQNILLRNSSRITTNAQRTATGGNIVINTNTLLAGENSDITANAQQGTGGRVSITAKGIFGTEFRNFTTPGSDITATSELGPQFNGFVQINSPDVNPAAGLVSLPENFTDPSSKIARTCSTQARTNSFVVTGRGGLPPTASEVLNSTPGWIDWRASAGGQGSKRSRGAEGAGEQREQGRHLGQGGISIQNLKSKIQNSLPIVEATTWAVTVDGRVQLVTQTPVSVFTQSNFSAATCINP